MYQNDRIEKSEAALFIPAGEFPDETRRLLAGCNTTAQHLWCPPAVYHDLPAVVSVSVKNDILGVQRHSAVFMLWDIPAGQSAPSVYVCTACFRVSRHRDVHGGTDTAQNYPVNGTDQNSPLCPSSRRITTPSYLIPGERHEVQISYRLVVPPEETEAVKMQSPVKWPQSCRMGSEKNSGMPGRVPNFHCWSAGYPGRRNCRWMPAIRSPNLLRSRKTPDWLFRDCHRWMAPYTESPPGMTKRGQKWRIQGLS